MTQTNSPTYRAFAPPDGPAKTPAVLAAWATGELLATPGAIYANARDLPALAATMLAERVAGSPRYGVVQPGTLWLLAAEVAA
jgi:hypothetical protein